MFQTLLDERGAQVPMTHAAFVAQMCLEYLALSVGLLLTGGLAY